MNLRWEWLQSHTVAQILHYCDVTVRLTLACLRLRLQFYLQVDENIVVKFPRRSIGLVFVLMCAGACGLSAKKCSHTWLPVHLARVTTASRYNH